jgi:hypothetical protein
VIAHVGGAPVEELLPLVPVSATMLAVAARLVLSKSRLRRRAR